MTFHKKSLLWIIPSIILVLIIAGYLLFPIFAQLYINNKIESFAEEKGGLMITKDCDISFLHCDGSVDISFDLLQLVEKNGKDTLLSANQLEMSLDIIQGFHIQKKLEKISAQNIHILLVKNDQYCNYEFLKSKSKKNEAANYSKLIYSYLEKLENYLPQQMDIANFLVTTEFDSARISYHISPMQTREGIMTGDLVINEGDTLSTRWKLSGMIDQEKQLYGGTLTINESNRATGNLPLIKKLKKIDFSFHQLAVNLTIDKLTDDHSFFHISGKMDSIYCFHHYISDQMIRVDEAAFVLDVALSPENIEIDSTSSLRLNHFELHPYFRYIKGAKPHLILKINEKHKDIREMFAALPDELFQVIPTLQAQGNIDFKMLFDCDFANLDSLKFDFNIASSDHSFSLGNDSEVITRFNKSFEYTYYYNGVAERTFIVGPENPNFCSFEEIPPYVMNAILTSEDPSFFYHRGFVKCSIESALIADLKSRRMSRGGSTITMQLVKNILLNRKKVLSRKFEEMMLVWMIENNHLISKERMFEIYINIVEWAPNINGIVEASRFYFDKKPKELTLAESMYLATLIRAPKHYAKTLDETGTVNANRCAEMIFLANRMLTQERITEDQLNSLNPAVHTVIIPPVKE